MAAGAWRATKAELLAVQSALSLLYGAGRRLPRSQREELRWLRREAAAGHVGAQAWLGLLYR